MPNNGVEIGKLGTNSQIEEWSDKEWDYLFRPIVRENGVKIVNLYNQLSQAKNVQADKFMLLYNSLITIFKIEPKQANKKFLPKIDNKIRELLNNTEYFQQITSNNGFFISSDYLKQGDILVNETEAYLVLNNGAKSESFIVPNTIIYTAPKRFKKPYQVRVTVPWIKVRFEPDRHSSIVTAIKKGSTLAISAEKGEWGKLAYSRGWVKLTYTEKVKKNV